MKKEIEALLKRLQVAVRYNPAEVFLSVLFCCFGCALYETSCASLAVVVYYFPVLFLITCTLNSMTGGVCLLSVCIVFYSVFLEG